MQQSEFMPSSGEVTVLWVLAANTGGMSRKDIAPQVDTVLSYTGTGVILHRLRKAGMVRATRARKYTITRAGARALRLWQYEQTRENQ